jgi:hypothetical protein
VLTPRVTQELRVRHAAATAKRDELLRRKQKYREQITVVEAKEQGLATEVQRLSKTVGRYLAALDEATLPPPVLKPDGTTWDSTDRIQASVEELMRERRELHWPKTAPLRATSAGQGEDASYVGRNLPPGVSRTDVLDEIGRLEHEVFNASVAKSAEPPRKTPPRPLGRRVAGGCAPSS